MVHVMANRVPNIAGDYPLAGEKIGPAWRDTWAVLSSGKWFAGADVAQWVAARQPVDPRTVIGLMQKARKAGLLEVKILKTKRDGVKRSRAHYRIKSKETN